MPTHLLRPAIIAITLAATLPARAGPPDPPPGPISPTYKTLTEVEPRVLINAANTPGDANSLFKITQSGSYYLGGNITGVAGKHGIEIAAVGFDLVGVPGSLSGVQGVGTNVAVINGALRNWGGTGIDVLNAPNAYLNGLRANNNTSNGFLVGQAAFITACTAFANDSVGFAISQASIAGCTAYGNGNGGFVVGVGCTLSNCAAYNNAGIGITLGTSCTVSACTASFNTGHGISSNFGGLITNCTVRGNDQDNIRVTNACTVLDNLCDRAGNTGAIEGAAIHATGSDNRIEGNNCTLSDRGIDVDAGGNIIIRNTCSGNTTNWTIAAGNALAPIVQATTNAAAVSGNTYAGSLGSTDPNANFTY
jgi:parallel beta-helix repeat protein